MKKIIIILTIVLPLISFSQEKEKKESKFKAIFSGFVKNDFFFDSRQTVAAREGHFLLWPKNVSKDLDGVDINARPNFNFLAIQSRLSVALSGPDAFGAKVSAKIEGDFFAQKADNINLLRLRHAYVKMNWTNTELLMGQYWIPMFVTSCFPGTVSFNTGAPLQPFGRNPQIRLTQKFGMFKFVAVASSQRDYASRAPTPTGEYMRNAMPELTAQIHINKDKKFLAGASIGYKQIMPTIVSSLNYATNEKVQSISGLVYARLNTAPVTVKMEAVYGQNMPDVLSIGGFAITEISDAAKGFVKYTPLSTASFWTDIHTNGKSVQYGIFGGYTKALGSSKDVVGAIYGFGTDIESLYRVSPRVIFNSGKVRFAIEGEYTVAKYGSAVDSKAIPINLTSVGNFRLLVGVYYFFKK